MKQCLVHIFSLASMALICCSCASVPMQSKDNDARAKRFEAPPKGYSGLYLFRDTALGCALKRKLYVDGQYLGKTGYKTYFHRFVTPGRHLVQTESEWGENETEIDAMEGKNHFVCQQILMGIFTGRADVCETSKYVGEKAVSSLKLAKDIDDHGRDLENAEYGPGKGSVSASEVLSSTEPVKTAENSTRIDAPPLDRPFPTNPDQTEIAQALSSTSEPLATEGHRSPFKAPPVLEPHRGGGADAASRLQKLNALRSEGVVSPEEYARKRADIIDSL